MDSIKFLYITCKDLVEARHIGRAIVEEQLAACVNIIPGMESIYRWQGKIESSEEVVLIAKTRSSVVALCTDRVQALHSYETPCILSIAIEGGQRDYVKWLLDETSAKK